MRRTNQALWQMAAAWYPVVVPSVASITSTAQTEGTTIDHYVVLSSVVNGVPASYAFSLTGVTATPGVDYNATPTFSNGVVISGGNIIVPVNVLSFHVYVATMADAVFEGDETYTLSIGGMTNTGNILDANAAPSIFSVSSASAAEGSSVVHLVTVAGVSQSARTFALSFTNGTATAGLDFTSTLTNSSFSAGVTISAGTITVPPGVTSFSVYVSTLTDALAEGSETYTLTVGGASGTGTIIDTPVSYTGYGAVADAGRVDQPGAETAWTSIANFNAGDFVSNGGSAFYALRAVPAGTATSNTTYWQPVVMRYYVDADNGNDTTYNGQSRYLGFVTNSDGSQGSANAAYGPWQTLTKLREVSLSGYWDTAGGSGGNSSTYPQYHPAWPSNNARGTIYLLKRGTAGEYTGQLQAAAWNATAVASIGDMVYGTYGTGARPLVNYAQSLAYYSSSGVGASWSRLGTKGDNIDFNMQFCFSCTVAAGGTGVFALGDLVSGNTSGATGVVQHLYGTSLTISCTSMPVMFQNETIQTSGNVKNGNISAVTGLGGVTFTDINHSILDGSVSNALGNGVLLSVGSYPFYPPHFAVVDNMTVSYCCNYQTNGAGIDGGGSSPALMVDGARFTRNTTLNNGNASRAHNLYLAYLSNVVISNNYSYMTGPGYGNHSLVIHGVIQNAIIEKNKWENCNNGLGINDGYSTVDEYFDNLDIRCNVNTGHGWAAGLNQGMAFDVCCLTNSRVYNNLNANTAQQYNIYSRRSTYARTSTNVSVAHETLYNVAGGMKFRSINSGTITGITVKNSILASTASSGYLLDIDATSGVTVDHCLFWMPANTGSAVNWFGTPMTLAALKTWLDTYQAGHGCIFFTDPLFTNASGGDFTLQVTSPCKGAGVPIPFATTDNLGDPRSLTTPSLGCYE